VKLISTDKVRLVYKGHLAAMTSVEGTVIAAIAVP
jgi:hypothetical protein